MVPVAGISSPTAIQSATFPTCSETGHDESSTAYKAVQVEGVMRQYSRYSKMQDKLEREELKNDLVQSDDSLKLEFLG